MVWGVDKTVTPLGPIYQLSYLGGGGGGDNLRSIWGFTLRFHDTRYHRTAVGSDAVKGAADLGVAAPSLLYVRQRSENGACAHSN